MQEVHPRWPPQIRLPCDFYIELPEASNMDLRQRASANVSWEQHSVLCLSLMTGFHFLQRKSPVCCGNYHYHMPEILL